MKLSKHLCLECSTCAIFFNSSFTVSIIARFLSSSLSDTLIKAPFMLFISLVISCMPSTNRRWKRFLLIYPLSPTSLPYMNSTKALYSIGILSSTSPGVIIKFSNSPPLVTYQMQLEAKEPPHGALASLRNALEHLVDMYPLVPAYSKGSAVHETYTSTFSEQHLLDE